MRYRTTLMLSLLALAGIAARVGIANLMARPTSTATEDPAPCCAGSGSITLTSTADTGYKFCIKVDRVCAENDSTPVGCSFSVEANVQRYDPCVPIQCPPVDPWWQWAGPFNYDLTSTCGSADQGFVLVDCVFDTPPGVNPVCNGVYTYQMNATLYVANCGTIPYRIPLDTGVIETSFLDTGTVCCE
jgi:hypothetical protein